MKKFFTLLFVALIALSANAAKQALPLDNLNAGWGSSYDAATHTITFEDAWKGRGWGYWGTPADYSLYDFVCIEFEETTMKVKIQVEYKDADGNNVSDATTASELVEPGATSVSVALNPDYKQFISQIYIQTDAAGTLTLTDAYLYKDGDVEKPQTKDIFNDFKAIGSIDGDGNLVVDTTVKEWDWKSKWYGDMDFSDFDYLVLELAEASEFAVQVSIQTVDAPDEKGMLEAGNLVLTMPLPETKNHVKCIALQNAAIGTFKVKAIYLATEEYINGGATAITTVKPVSVSNVRYNIAGQRTNSRGLVIENGKKYILK